MCVMELVVNGDAAVMAFFRSIITAQRRSYRVNGRVSPDRTFCRGGGHFQIAWL